MEGSWRLRIRRTHGTQRSITLEGSKLPRVRPRKTTSPGKKDTLICFVSQCFESELRRETALARLVGFPKLRLRASPAHIRTRACATLTPPDEAHRSPANAS